MSIQTEIQRIQTAKVTLRNKGISLGIATEADNITELAVKFDGIVDRGTPNAEVKEGESVTLQEGYYHGGTIEGVAGGGNYSLQAKTATPSKSEQSITSDDGYYGMSSVTVKAIPAMYQDVTDVTATQAQVLTGAVYVDNKGAVKSGTMANKGAVSKTLDATTTSYTVPAGYHNGSGKVQVVTEDITITPQTSQVSYSATAGKLIANVTCNAISDRFGLPGELNSASANASHILYGKTAVICDPNYTGTGNAPATKVTGTMTNNAAVSPAALDCGASYTIPAGYHNGSGKVTAKSLASQTGVQSGKTAIGAGQVLTGYQGWVSGTRISGSMPNNGAITGYITGLGAVTGDTSYTIPAGYTTGGTISISNDIETALAAI